MYCLSGFSMGATMATEIMGRGNVHIDKVFIVNIIKEMPDDEK